MDPGMNESKQAMLELQRKAGIPHIPTQITYEARLAVAGEGPRAADWADKPHRLVYDLCREVEQFAALTHPQPGGAVAGTERGTSRHYTEPGGAPSPKFVTPGRED